MDYSKKKELGLPPPDLSRFGGRTSKALPARSLRVADQIRRELAQLISFQLRDPRIKWVTVQSVEISSDYAYAKIYITTLLDSPDEVVSALNTAAGYLHRLIYKRLSIHTIPTLRFFEDKSLLEAKRIDELIETARLMSSLK